MNAFSAQFRHFQKNKAAFDANVAADERKKAEREDLERAAKELASYASGRPDCAARMEISGTV